MPLATLGDCLAETTKHVPKGYIRFTGCVSSFWHNAPADQKDETWFTVKPITAAITLAPLQLYILAGTKPATAREILKKICKFLKESGDELPMTTQIPTPLCDDDDVPF